MDIASIMAGISEEPSKSCALTPKKSILNHKSQNDEFMEVKRTNSKIQWMSVPEKTEEGRKFLNTSVPVLGILASRGYRWHFIHDAMVKLHSEEMKHAVQTEEEMRGDCKKAFNYLIQDLGSGVLQKRYNKNAELTLDQQTQLETVKHKVKIENDAYLRIHPEIAIMIKLVYAALFKNQPQKPKKFMSDYVHYLNQHREELVDTDVDIPFDRPAVPEEITSEAEDRQQIRDFARQIVESCLNAVALGESYIDVMSIISSILNVVTRSDSETTIESVISNAETAVSEILMSLLTSVAIEKSTSAELVVSKLLDTILSSTGFYVRKDSEVYTHMRESVENYVRSLLESLTDKVLNNRYILETMEEPEVERENQLVDTRGKSILRREHSIAQDEELRTRTKVKFQSVS